jgi:hypothetical protein
MHFGNSSNRALSDGESEKPSRERVPLKRIPHLGLASVALGSVFASYSIISLIFGLTYDWSFYGCGTPNAQNLCATVIRENSLSTVAVVIGLCFVVGGLAYERNRKRAFLALGVVGVLFAGYFLIQLMPIVITSGT